MIQHGPLHISEQLLQQEPLVLLLQTVFLQQRRAFPVDQHLAHVKDDCIDHIVLLLSYSYRSNTHTRQIGV